MPFIEWALIVPQFHCIQYPFTVEGHSCYTAFKKVQATTCWPVGLWLFHMGRPTVCVWYIPIPSHPEGLYMVGLETVQYQTYCNEGVTAHCSLYAILLLSILMFLYLLLQDSL